MIKDRFDDDIVGYTMKICDIQYYFIFNPMKYLEIKAIAFDIHKINYKLITNFEIFKNYINKRKPLIPLLHNDLEKNKYNLFTHPIDLNNLHGGYLKYVKLKYKLKHNILVYTLEDLK